MRLKGGRGSSAGRQIPVRWATPLSTHPFHCLLTDLQAGHPLSRIALAAVAAVTCTQDSGAGRGQAALKLPLGPSANQQVARAASILSNTMCAALPPVPPFLPCAACNPACLPACRARPALCRLQFCLPACPPGTAASSSSSSSTTNLEARSLSVHSTATRPSRARWRCAACSARRVSSMSITSEKSTTSAWPACQVACDAVGWLPAAAAGPDTGGSSRQQGLLPLLASAAAAEGDSSPGRSSSGMTAKPAPRSWASAGLPCGPALMLMHMGGLAWRLGKNEASSSHTESAYSGLQQQQQGHARVRTEGRLQWNRRNAGETTNAPPAGAPPGHPCTHPELSSGGCRLAWPTDGRMQEWVGCAAAALPPKAQRCWQAAEAAAAAGAADVRCWCLKALASMDHVLLAWCLASWCTLGSSQGSKLGGRPTCQPALSRSRRGSGLQASWVWVRHKRP